MNAVRFETACVALVSPVVAQSGSDAPISTDRPGFLFAPTVVPPRRLQFETGFPTLTIFEDAGDEARTWSLPVAVRYGLSETLELRASLPTWTETRSESGAISDRDEGFGDVELGAKLALAPLAGGPLALQGSLRLPTGADDFTKDEVGGSMLLLHGRDLAGFWLQTMAGGLARADRQRRGPDERCARRAGLASDRGGLERLRRDDHPARPEPRGGTGPTIQVLDFIESLQRGVRRTSR